MQEVVIGSLGCDELSAAAGVLGRGYRDTPTSIALLGGNPQLREEVTARIMRFRVAQMDPPPLAAYRGDTLVGVCGLAPSEAPPPSQERQRELVHILHEAGPGVVERARQMALGWRRMTPKEPHWHLGPIAVEPELWGQGIGSLMIERFCTRVDRLRAMAYLETDLPESVHLYERFGFSTVGEGPIIGVHNWFMVRPAGTAMRDSLR